MGPDAGERVRAIRLRALTDSPDAFRVTFAEDEARPLAEWRTRLESPDNATFIASERNQDVGLAVGSRHQGQDGAAGLFAMWVAPESRDRGIGGALVDAVVAWARTGGYRRVLCDVADRNVQATRLFAKKGFAPTGAIGSLPAPREHILEHQQALELLPDTEAASSTIEIPSAPSGSPAMHPPLTAQAKRALAVEVLIVLSVGWFGSYYYSAAEYIWPELMSQPLPFWYVYLDELVREVPLIALVILMARRGGDTWADLGLIKPRPFRDFFTVGVCFFGVEMARTGYWLYLLPLIERFLPEDDATRWLKYFPAPHGPLQQTFAVLSIFVWAFSEEILMRAYLLPRLERLLGSSAEAVFLGALLFALGHVYQGFEGAFLAGLFGFVYGVIFLVTRRLWPLAAAHAANNLYVFFTQWP